MVLCKTRKLSLLQPFILVLFNANVKVEILPKNQTQTRITKQLLTSISIDIRIYQPEKVIFTQAISVDIRIYQPEKVIFTEAGYQPEKVIFTEAYSPRPDINPKKWYSQRPPASEHITFSGWWRSRWISLFRVDNPYVNRNWSQ